MALIFIIALMQIFLQLCSANFEPGPIANTKNGMVQGSTHSINGTRMYAFQGIPYAEPPIEWLRFRKPMPKNNWRGVYVASEFQAQCMQPASKASMDTLQSEDCLYLNVFTPYLNPPKGLPVMVFIHGGSLIKGSGAWMDNGVNQYDGKALAAEGVVVVTINYRLGVFGFFVGQKHDAPGNVGYWDQYQSLIWVKENIKHFGGNPNDITLFGQNAGAWAISSHSVSPITGNMFRKAILQSGSAYLKKILTDVNSGIRLSRDFATNPNYFKGNACYEQDYVECLRNKSSYELNSAQTAYMKAFYKDSIPFKSIYGDEFLPYSVVEALRIGYFNKKINFLIGHNEMEGLYQEYTQDFDETLHNRYDPKVYLPSDISKKKVKDDIDYSFINDRSIPVKIGDLYTESLSDFRFAPVLDRLRRSGVHAYGDYLYTCPTVLFGAKIVKNEEFKGNVYQYRLTYANSKSIAYKSNWAYVTHTDELPLVFGRPKQEEGWTAEDRKMSATFVNIWTHFAKYGYPPTVNGVDWPVYTWTSSKVSNISYLELHPDLFRLGKLYINKYKGNDGYETYVVNNCYYFWEKILVDQYH